MTRLQALMAVGSLMGCGTPLDVQSYFKDLPGWAGQLILCGMSTKAATKKPTWALASSGIGRPTRPTRAVRNFSTE